MLATIQNEFLRHMYLQYDLIILEQDSHYKGISTPTSQQVIQHLQHGGTMWRWRGILDWTHDSGSKGCGFDSRPCLALLSFSKTHYSHCCSPPRCKNGYQVGCEGYVAYVFACNATIGSSAKNAPLGVEIVHCKCSLEIVSNDWGNNSMLRLEHPRWMEMCAL